MILPVVTPGRFVSGRTPDRRFWHEALFYSGGEDFVRRTSAFVRDGLAAGEPVLILLIGPKIDLLRQELGSDADRIQLGDMAEIGRNPGRIISRWQEFVDERGASGGRVRGIGEPIWAERTAEELVEAQRHESLLNLAFIGSPAWVLCPYDVATLDRSVIEEAYRSHPIITNGDAGLTSETYRRLGDVARPFDDPLEPAPRSAESFQLSIEDLSAMRHLLIDRAAKFGLSPERSADFVLAANEVASNSLRYGAGAMTLRTWDDGDALVCDVSDEGRIASPLAGRRRPSAGDPSGYGLWLANELCDLVQLRSFADGSTVRLRMIRR